MCMFEQKCFSWLYRESLKKQAELPNVLSLKMFLYLFGVQLDSSVTLPCNDVKKFNFIIDFILMLLHYLKIASLEHIDTIYFQ